MMAASADWNRTPEWCCRPLRPVRCRRREKACKARMQSRAETERRGVEGLIYANNGSDRILALDHWVDPEPTQIDDTRDRYGKHQSADRRRQRLQLSLARAVRASCTCDEECHRSSHRWRVSAPQELFMRNIVCRCDQGSSADEIRHIPSPEWKRRQAPQRPYP